MSNTPTSPSHLLLLNTLADSLKTKLEHLSAGDSLHAAGQSVTSILPSRPAAVITLAHQKLHAFPFREVPLCWRRAYEEACLWKVLKAVEEQIRNANSSGKSLDGEKRWVEDIIKTCDMALILTGAPGRRDLIHEVLATLDLYGQDDQKDLARPVKRRRLDVSASIMDELVFATATKRAMPRLTHEISRISAPSLQRFRSHMHSARHPIIISNTIQHWPALERWQSPEYWLRRTHGGKRLVPVEIGRSYTEEGWGQKIMPFGEYLLEHLVEKEAGDSGNKAEAKGYLAQHDLLAQIPALRGDISIPDYCYIDPPRPPARATTKDSPAKIHDPASPYAEDAESDTDEEAPETLLNIWLGPEQTISPAHTDPHHNILAQVVGRKYIRLFAPSETKKMYPLSGGSVDMGNTSSVDVGAFVDVEASSGQLGNDEEDRRDEQRVRYPLFQTASFVEGVVEPGDCIYIPKGWWHYVRSLEVSCSVSFWWD